MSFKAMASLISKPIQLDHAVKSGMVAEVHTFGPDWGRAQKYFWDLALAVRGGQLQTILEEWSKPGHWDNVPDGERVQFSMSLLGDLLRSGGRIWERDSKLYAAWPTWDSPSGRGMAREAMLAARELRPLTKDEIKRVECAFAPDIEGYQLAKVMQEAEFTLVPAVGNHPSGASYSEIFAAALRFWTMPYRGRTGRMKRFVLLAKHEKMGKWPVVAAILELGDEAPFCTWRDELIGLSYKSLSEWLEKDIVNNAKSALQTMHNVRKCLQDNSDGVSLRDMSAEEIWQQKEKLHEYAKGRSLVENSETGREDLWRSKRVAHGLRLARGEVALQKIIQVQAMDRDDADLAAGVRGLHDIFLTRLHLEATICGAVPPFSEALGGKLLAAFLAHPDILAAPLAAEGTLLARSFDMNKLQELLPSHGMSCLTTKGLYPGHAAIYNRVEVPGLSTPIKMKHLADTDGATTSLLSTRTSNLAKGLIEAIREQQVSTVYGSGGSKRHRAVESAMTAIGLPGKLAMAGIKRPVYGLQFLENPQDVVWASEEPKWNVYRTENSASYNKRATELWRKRWLERASSRCYEYVLIPSLPTILFEAGLN
jgi:hypothetical protein